MKLRTIAAAITIGLAAAGCAKSSPNPPGSSIAHPMGRSQLVLRIDTAGGFVNPAAILDRIPQFTLYGDGTAIAPGVVTEIYPGPALVEPIATPISEDAVQAILRAAKDAGLFRNVAFTNLGSVGIADAPTTTITVNANGATYVTRVYALGEATGPRPAAMSQQEFDARKAISGFVGKTADLRSWLPKGSVDPDAPYMPGSLAVYVGSYRKDQTLSEPVAAWPLATALASFGQPVRIPQEMRCGTVTGNELTQLMPLVQDANQLTPWVSDGRRFGLTFRPLLPDQTGC